MAHDAAHGNDTFKKVWVPFFILLVITIIEFVVALAIPNSVMPHAPYKVGLYAVLTIAKAFYIVGFFMHLKFEKIGLAYAIVVPTAFIIALVAALIFEGSTTHVQ
jgi:cytochrome c oxidase subunit IV